MRYVLLLALFWHSAAVPSEFVGYFKKSIAACFSITKKILNNDKHANYAIASAAIVAGATSLFYSIKKVIARVSFIKEKPQRQNPIITITTTSPTQLKPAQKRRSWSILITSSENTPLPSPLPSRNHSRKNSAVFIKPFETEQLPCLGVIPEDQDVQLHVSKANDDPLSEDQVAELQRIANQMTPKASRIKRKSQKKHQDQYRLELEEMLKIYNEMAPEDPPVHKETRTGLWWLQWEPGGSRVEFERLVLTFNGQEINPKDGTLALPTE